MICYLSTIMHSTLHLLATLLYSNLVLSRGTCTDSHFPSKSPDSPTGKPRALGRVLQSILRWMFSESISDAFCPGGTPVHPCISAGSARRDSHPRVPRSPPDPRVHFAKSPAPKEKTIVNNFLWFPMVSYGFIPISAGSASPFRKIARPKRKQ